MVSNELFEVEVGGDTGFKGVKQEVKSALKGKESIRIGVTVNWYANILPTTPNVPLIGHLH